MWTLLDRGGNMEKCIDVSLTENELVALFQMSQIVSVQGRDAKALVSLQEKLEKILKDAGIELKKQEQKPPSQEK